MSLTPYYVGLDFAKANFTYFHPQGQGTLPNTAQGHIRLFASLPAGAHLVCESTGPYHQALTLLAHQRGVALTVANPAQVRHFIKGRGQRAKTDALDAQGLHLFGVHNQPQADLAVRPAERALQELVVARQQAVLEASTLKVQAALPVGKLVQRLLDQRLKLLAKQIQTLEQAMAKTVAEDPLLKTRVDRLLPVQGLGFVSAVTAVALCPELGSLTRNEASALLGVAPYPDQSGDVDGPRAISGGRMRLRHALYMAALSAARHNPVLKPFYQKLRTRGKAGKVALIAVLRKLFQLLNHLLKNPDFTLAT